MTQTQTAIPGKHSADTEFASLGLLLIVMLTVAAFSNWFPKGAEVAPKMQAKQARAHVAEKSGAEIDQRFSQGVVMLHAKRFDHAITSFHRVIELAPNMPEAHVNMGYALLGSGNAKAAADFFAGAIDLRPHQLNAYYGMALARAALGDLNGAIESMRAYLHRTPADDPYRAKAQTAIMEWQKMLEDVK